MDQPDPLLVIVVWLSLSVLAMLLISMAYGAVRQLVRPKSATEEAQAGEEITVKLPTLSEAKAAIVSHVAATIQKAGQRIATPTNEGNEVLPGNAVAPAEARDIIRFEAKVEAAIAIIVTGKIGQTETIKAVFGCSPSSKPESIYQKARTAILARLDSSPRFRQDDGTTGPATYPITSDVSTSH